MLAASHSGTLRLRAEQGGAGEPPGDPPAPTTGPAPRSEVRGHSLGVGGTWAVLGALGLLPLRGQGTDCLWSLQPSMLNALHLPAAEGGWPPSWLLSSDTRPGSPEHGPLLRANYLEAVF